MKTPWAALAVLGIGGLLATFAFVALASVMSSRTSPEGFRAGWTATRTADLTLRLKGDSYVTPGKAECVAKEIAHSMTWQTWQDLAATDQEVGVILSGRNC